MSDTKIEWADRTWNPITGCSPVSEGCQNCYAARMTKRLAGRFGYPKDDPFKVTFHPDKLDQPLLWKKPKRIFVCSMGDLFHDEVSFEMLELIFENIKKAPQHIYILLTKRPYNVLKFLKHWNEQTFIPAGHPYEILDKNIWIGVTCENQKTADERIPILLEIPATVKFISAEPMLESINLHTFTGKYKDCKKINKRIFERYIDKLNWVICGSETGPRARIMKNEWARDLLAQCRQASVPFFIKKLSGNQIIPDDLKVRKFPIYRKVCQQVNKSTK